MVGGRMDDSSSGSAGPVHLVEPTHDGGVVRRRCGRRRAGQPAAGGGRQGAELGQLPEHRPYSSGETTTPDVGVVLRRRPHHGRSPDVDELDGGVGAERVEVAHHQVDEADALALEVGQVLGLGPVGQDPAVDGGVEGLHPAAQHLGRAGEDGHLDVVDTGLGQGGRGAAARDQLPAQVGQALGQFDQTGLVVYGQQCPHGATSEGDPVPSVAVAANPSMKARMVSG